MMKSNTFLARAAGAALLGVFWLAPGAGWALEDCPTGSAGSDVPCLGGTLGVLKFVTAQGKGNKAVAEWQFDGQDPQLVETKGNDCRPESGHLVSYSEYVGFKITLGEDSGTGGDNCGAVSNEVDFTYEVGAATESLLDIEGKGDVDAKIVLFAGGAATGDEIWIRAGGAEPWTSADIDSGACGGVRNALAPVYSAPSVPDPLGGFDGVLGGDDAYDGPSPLCVNGCQASDSCPDSDDHFPIEHTFVHDSMKIVIENPGNQSGTVGVGGGLSGGPVVNGTQFNISKLYDGTLACGDVKSTDGFDLAEYDQVQAQIVRLQDDPLFQTGQVDSESPPKSINCSVCTQATPYTLEAGTATVTFDADVASDPYRDQACSAYKFFVQYNAEDLDPSYGTQVDVEAADLDYSLTATAKNNLAQLLQTFKNFDDQSFFLDVCPTNLLYSDSSPALIDEPANSGQYVSGMCFEDPVTGVCLPPGDDDDTYPDGTAVQDFSDGTAVPVLTDMSLEDFRQFGCYFRYEIVYDPRGEGNLNEAVIRVWGLLHGDWTSLRPSAFSLP